MGAGAALIMPATMSVITNVFTDRGRAGQAIGLWAAVSGLGVAIGPVAGGWLLAHFSWGSIFLVNLPIVTLALLAGHWLVPASATRGPAASTRPARHWPRPAHRPAYTLIQAPGAGGRRRHPRRAPSAGPARRIHRREPRAAIR